MSTTDQKLQAQPDQPLNAISDQPQKIKPDWAKYAMAITAIVVIIVIAYYAYTSFYNNQEGYVEWQDRTGVDADKSFDVDAEVQRLSDIQEEYLRQINAQRNM
jgi:uncharacterized membrane protein YvbJ